MRSGYPLTLRTKHPQARHHSTHACEDESSRGARGTSLSSTLIAVGFLSGTDGFGPFVGAAFPVLLILGWLTVDRVNFLRRHVTIDRQIVTPDNGPVAFGPPKTKSSNRTVTLPKAVGEILAAHIAEFGVGEGGLIFTSSTGAPLGRSMWQAAFTRAARDTNINASSHDLRHHCDSLLISSGCSVKAVQQYLGHKNASETLDTYGHLWPGDEDRIRAAIDAGFAGVVHEMCMDGYLADA